MQHRFKKNKIPEAIKKGIIANDTFMRLTILGVQKCDTIIEQYIHSKQRVEQIKIKTSQYIG